MPFGFILVSGTPVKCYMLFAYNPNAIEVVKSRGGVISPTDKINLISVSI
jgi:hypothetical protein